MSTFIGHDKVVSIMISMAAKISLMIVLLSILLPMMVLLQSSPPLKLYSVPSGGAEAFAFDGVGRFYTGVNDGRILRYDKLNGFVDFAYTAPNRTKTACDGNRNLTLGNVCGRPFGLAFHLATNKLYIVDGYYGLCVVGLQGGFATSIFNSFGGVPFKFTDAVDVDQTTGKVYLTDLSSKYNMGEFLNPNRTDVDSSGRVLEYDPITKSGTLLVRDVQAPNGIVVSADSSFVLFSSYTGNKVYKHWLQGPKANTTEVLMTVSAPDNITPVNQRRYFWLASNGLVNSSHVPMPTGIKIDGNGAILRTVTFGDYLFPAIYEVHEFLGRLYVTSTNFIGIGRL